MRRPRKQTALWTSADGSRRRICDMHDAHLRNAALFLARHAAWARAVAQLAGLTFGPSWRDHADPSLHRLELDAERRGLDVDLDGVGARLDREADALVELARGGALGLDLNVGVRA